MGLQFLLAHKLANDGFEVLVSIEQQYFPDACHLVLRQSSDHHLLAYFFLPLQPQTHSFHRAVRGLFPFAALPAHAPQVLLHDDVYYKPDINLNERDQVQNQQRFQRAPALPRSQPDDWPRRLAVSCRLRLPTGPHHPVLRAHPHQKDQYPFPPVQDPEDDGGLHQVGRRREVPEARPGVSQRQLTVWLRGEGGEDALLRVCLHAHPLRPA